MSDARLYRSIEQAILLEVRWFVERVEGEAVQILEREGRNYSGDTAGSITANTYARVAGRGSIEGGVGAGTDYAYYVHEGRGPGKMPPYDVISEWVRVKLGIGANVREAREVSFTTKDGKDVAFTAQVQLNDQVTRAVQHKIAKEGTEGTPFLREPWERAAPNLEPAIRDAVQRAASDYSIEFEIRMGMV